MASQDQETRAGELYSSIWETFTDEQYAQMAHDIWHVMFRLHEPLAPYVAGAKVLDAGCGGGSGIYMLLKEGAASVTGVDLSPRALDHCRRIMARFLPEKTRQVELHASSVLNLPFADASFDVAYSNGVLHHTSDPFRGFTEMVRCLKPGGIIWVGLYGAGGLMTGVLIPLARALREIVPRSATERFLRVFTSDPLSIYRVIDPMYTPYRFAYRAEDILGWIEKCGLAEPLRTYRCGVSFYKYGPWMSGEGWVGFRARKPL